MATLGFFGAAGEVTGSCTLLRTAASSVLVDMGMHQGEAVADAHNRRVPDLEPTKLTSVVLTHAHLDHCGRLPMLVRAGFTGPIYCTPPTVGITEIILRDAAELQSADSERFNRRLRRPGEAAAEPLYTMADVEKTLQLLRPVKYNSKVQVAPDVFATFFDAGHILGSASVALRIEERPKPIDLIMSGDIGVRGSPILRDPVTPIPADVVVMESTYGDRDHRSREDTIKELLSILQQAQAEGGKVLIPAFAVGRTQDLLFYLGEFLRSGALKNLNVYVDSPMASKVSQVYRDHREVYDEHARSILDSAQSPLSFPGLNYVQSIEESKRLNDAKGCMIVIAASGMCTGGRIVHHLMHNLPRAQTRVLIVGYQGQGTLGRRLVDGQKRVRIYGEDIIVNAKIHTLGGFSAHAGKSELVQWASAFKNSHPRFILNHGEDAPRIALAQALKSAHNLDCELPAYAQTYQL